MKSLGLKDKPKSLHEIKTAIAKREVRLSPALEKVARQALERPEIVAFESAAEIANRCSVSTTALTRLARCFGFSTFREMKKVFQDNLRSGSARFATQAPKIVRSVQPG
ncbi:MurR/RpiR family transcriptional regulator [Mesorhizobium sp. B2-5-4]|uniref:MurR/RpiR family transcriptional regulator n=1 Tax=unclassified Mesorhizobium TaxID=325217 RepID=UPI00112A9FB9|nr:MULTISPECIES: MurR/RpiR family transcriptional regulator [unclassified Mesorhizobium]TPJ40518.1 MurR/RpiR family transcriptional regulator [Mesorhizobium sp. B2-6-5]TPJ84752.1 MurR/RpiR family transcriptional regulator [Mesorhizobium sp. B2-5-13]TPK43769.1 MurR/RpiR family transcriptional regulator [Mesorhizobium sp. B2-5-4]TPK50898.1 MurR/RpiR family transcriptional regulator [Mesorhizobium sp. B2-5-5]